MVDVVLRHVGSEFFLSCSKRNGETKKIAYFSKISHYCNPGMTFSVLPKYKSRKIGEQIQILDELIFENILNPNYFLDMAPDLPHYLNNFSLRLPENKYRKEISLDEIRSDRFEVVFSQRTFVSWRVILVRSSERNSDREAVKGLSLVR